MRNFNLLKKRIRKNEGFCITPYFDSLGFATIGYGHLIKKNEKNFFSKKYSKENLNKIFEVDFSIAVNLYNKEYTIKKHNKEIKEIYIEMIFQLGIKGQKKFTKMHAYIDKKEYFMAALEMKNSLWYKQTPKRVEGLIKKLLNNQYEKKR